MQSVLSLLSWCSVSRQGGVLPTFMVPSLQQHVRTVPTWKEDIYQMSCIYIRGLIKSLFKCTEGHLLTSDQVSKATDENVIWVLWQYFSLCTVSTNDVLQADLTGSFRMVKQLVLFIQSPIYGRSERWYDGARLRRSHMCPTGMSTEPFSRHVIWTGFSFEFPTKFFSIKYFEMTGPIECIVEQ